MSMSFGNCYKYSGGAGNPDFNHPNNTNHNKKKKEISTSKKRRIRDFKKPLKLKVDYASWPTPWLEQLLEALEPSIHVTVCRIIREEFQHVSSQQGTSMPVRSSLSQLSSGRDVRKLRLQLTTTLPPLIYEGVNIQGINEGRANDKAIHVVLLDASTGQVVSSGPESSLKLEVVVLLGHFDPGNAEGWTREDFEAFIAKERQGMRPLLIGDLQVKLENGVATIEKLQFTDNSSWTWNKKFQIGIRVAPGCATTGICIQEAKTEPFSVLCRRGESYKKHTPPVPNDEVWRLKRIAKGSALHKQLSEEKIFTVEDFLRCLSTDSNKLQHIRGRRLCEKAWKEMVEHARTCRPNGKCYIYYTDETQRCGIIGNNFFQFIGTIAEGKISTEESIPHDKKVYLERAWKQACENPNQLVEYDSVVFMHDLANTQSFQSPEEHSMSLATNAIPTVDRGGILQFKHVIQDKNAEAGQYPTMAPVKVLDNCIHVSEANHGFMHSLIFPKEEFSQDEQGCMTPAVPTCHAYGSTASPSPASSSAPDHLLGRDCLASTTNPYYDASYCGRLDHGLSLEAWPEDFPAELFLRSCIQGTDDVYDDSSNFEDSPDTFP